VAKEETHRAPTEIYSDHDALRCRSCELPITEEAYRVERGGSHEHTFVNPHGIAHHIGCFVAAPGCSYRGHTETAFSWFPGWSWQIAICSRCHTHLGWIFRCAGEQFHGLILAALRT
jgi:hypothetical protein